MKDLEDLKKRVRSFYVDEDGPTATEYAVMLALIVLACIVAIAAIGTKVESMFTSLTGQLPV